MNSDYLALHESGLSYGQIAARFGVSRNAVAGSIYRARNPDYWRERSAKFFRDPEHTRNCVALADAIGLNKASRMLGMDAAQLCRWRKRLRAIEAAQ